jgi:hypothetical protein
MIDEILRVRNVGPIAYGCALEVAIQTERSNPKDDVSIITKEWAA